MNPALDLYNQISELPGLRFMPALESGSIIIDSSTSQEFAQQNALHNYLAEYYPASGWLCYQSQTNRFTNQKSLKSPTEESGWLLQGELYLPDQDLSIHIRQSSSGSWLVTKLRESKQDQHASGLLQTVSLIAMPMEQENNATSEQPPADKLFYRVYWEQTKNQGFQRCRSRFIGFTADQTNQGEN